MVLSCLGELVECNLCHSYPTPPSILLNIILIGDFLFFIGKLSSLQLLVFGQELNEFFAEILLAVLLKQLGLNKV